MDIHLIFTLKKLVPNPTSTVITGFVVHVEMREAASWRSDVGQKRRVGVNRMKKKEEGRGNRCAKALRWAGHCEREDGESCS